MIKSKGETLFQTVPCREAPLFCSVIFYILMMLTLPNADQFKYLLTLGGRRLVAKINLLQLLMTISLLGGYCWCCWHYQMLISLYICLEWKGGGYLQKLNGSDCHLETLIREVGHFVAPLLIIHIAIINVINVVSKKGWFNQLVRKLGSWKGEFQQQQERYRTCLYKLLAKSSQYTVFQYHA